VTTTYDVVGAAPGTALAPAWRPRPSGAAAASVAAGPEDVASAFAAAAARLDDLASSFRANGATESADILEAEALIARDPLFLEEALSAVQSDDASSAMAAVQQVADRHAAAMELLDSSMLRERAADIRQVGRMVVEQLAGGRREPPAATSFVLVAEEVTAPDLLENADQVVGAVSTRGGAGSHAAIVARSLGVPLVVQAPGSAVEVPDGTLLLVDADRGRLVVSPDKSTLGGLRHPSPPQQNAAGALTERLTTADGVEVSLLANIASAVEARRAVAAGAVGVGLVRTELAFLDAPDWPTFLQHELQLRPMLQPLAGRPVSVRLLDFTNDKRPPFLHAGTPSNSGQTLGLATLLNHPWALDEQLRAILSAGRDVGLGVLVPMVSDAHEVESVRRRLESVLDGRAPVPVGAMVELPEAAERAVALAQASDFLSLGTNDLTAATLGLARTDARLTPAMTAHPAVLRCIALTVDAATALDCPVSVCGDAAADATVLPLLVGAGLRSFSVGVSRLGDVRALVRGLDVTSCVDVLEQAVTLSDEAAVRRLVTSEVRTNHAS
jgi:phosphoenolpyruvate-protein kinase (PTS system EI component)